MAVNAIPGKKIPNVVIFGRANVGKSTLFNRLTERQQALVSIKPGTTRDAHEQGVEWNGVFFNLVDTGGIININKKISNIDNLVQKQVFLYLKNADIIVLLVDIRDGLLPVDKNLAAFLKKNYPLKKIILVANKADTEKLRAQSAEFHKLGIGEPLALSAANGSGTGDLLDKIVLSLRQQKKHHAQKPTNNTKTIKTCIVGKPNAGKSSLLNAFLGENKVIVSQEPHTTREPNNYILKFKDNKLELIDTAGLSRKGQKYVKNKRLKNSLEKLSISKTLNILGQADVALLILDINEELSIQETKIVDAILEKKTSLIIVANKWDLIKKRDTKHYTFLINQRFPFITWAPIIFISAKNKKNIKKLLTEIILVAKAREATIKENQLDKFLKNAIKRHSPSRSKGFGRPFIHKLKQTGTKPLRFSISLGHRDSIQKSYLKYLENSLRKKFSLSGASISIYVDKGKKRDK